MATTSQLTLFAPNADPNATVTLADDPNPTVTFPSGDAAGSVGERRLALRRTLSQRLGLEVVSLKLTRNRRRMLSAKPGGSGLEVRLHRAFLGAPEDVLDAVARLCDRSIRGASRRQALAVAREYFAEHAADHMTATSKLRLRPRGRVYDLQRLRDRIEAEYFDGDLPVDIGWGHAGRGNADLRRGGIHIRLGSYDATHNLVRIHPVLDRQEVPEYVVESVVYHEMLHAAEPPIQGGARRTVHTRAFRRRERQYRHHDAAEQWIEANLQRLARWRQRP